MKSRLKKLKMGCGSSKKASIVPVIENVDDFVVNTSHKLPPIRGNNKVTRRSSQVFALPGGVDLPTETLEESTIRRRKNIGAPLAFEVPAVDDGESLIRKHPPRRFQRLEDQQVPNLNLTHEILDEKLAEAEQRRIQLMTQRVQSAKTRVPQRRPTPLENFVQGEDAGDPINPPN